MDKHIVTDLFTVSDAGGSVTCRCGWTGHADGARSELLDLWAQHVTEAEEAERHAHHRPRNG